MKNSVILIGVFFFLTTFSFSFKAQESKSAMRTWYNSFFKSFSKEDRNKLVPGIDYSNDELVIEVDPLKFNSTKDFEKVFRNNSSERNQSSIDFRSITLSNSLSIDFKIIAQKVSESLKIKGSKYYSVELYPESVTATIPGLSEGTCGKVLARFRVSPPPKNDFSGWDDVIKSFREINLAKINIASQDSINSINPDGFVLNRSKNINITNNFINQFFSQNWTPGVEITRVAIVDTFGDHGNKVSNIIKYSSQIQKISVKNYGGCTNIKCDSIEVASAICASAFSPSDRDKNADIINLSLGGPTPSPIIAGAIGSAISANIVVLASGGNTGKERKDKYNKAPDGASIFPAGYSFGFSEPKYGGLIAVGAVEQEGSNSYAQFATAREYIDVSAPGIFRAQFGSYQGTSYSSAYATGVVAKMIYILRTSGQKYDPGSLRSNLIDLAESHPVQNCPRLNLCGAGVVYKR